MTTDALRDSGAPAAIVLPTQPMSARAWGWALLGWTFFGLWALNQNQLSTVAGGRPIDAWAAPFRIYMASAWLWAIFTPAIVLFARHVRFERRHLWRSVALHLAAAVVVAVLDARVDTLLFHRLSDYPPRAFIQQIFQQGNINLALYGTVVGAVNALDYSRALGERSMREAALQTQLARAELQALRAQLHPHFLFNTLHAISALMHRDVRAADRMLVQLSDLLRMAIDSVGAQEVSLLEELGFVERYLEIEQARLGDRLSVRLNADPRAYDALVPHLILQPLVENAVKHGVAPLQDPGHVTVSASREGDRLLLSVRDSGAGLAPDQLPWPREGVGLRNTRERLAHLYGRAHVFEMRMPDDGGLEVVVALPFRTHAGDPTRSEEPG